jgi:hypothetical protein
MNDNDLFYISAQPDEFYFYWQLDIQIFNFLRIGVSCDNIHILIGYKDKISIDGHNFKNKYYNKVNIYFYEDERKYKPSYIPSIRPYLLQKHFKLNKYLENKIIFYHDCDIILKKKLDINKYLNDDICYLSDTRSYLKVSYIQEKGFGLLENMCKIVGVGTEQVKNIDNNCGGAQYLLKNISSKFWGKVERNSNQLYTYLENSKELYGKSYKGFYNPIQSWCSDMWALLWNLIILNKEVKIISELNFVHATDNIEQWKYADIFHNAGVTNKDKKFLFNKNDYRNSLPKSKEIIVDNNFCSSIYVNEIKNFENSEIFFNFTKREL